MGIAVASTLLAPGCHALYAYFDRGARWRPARIGGRLT
ncbi:hypothetical protein GLA29479_2193 [Lysobacter antibioticus]|nr:hypothetical protein GLA29479_2193 [Lysobacter antibioticus]